MGNLFFKHIPRRTFVNVFHAWCKRTLDIKKEEEHRQKKEQNGICPECKNALHEHNKKRRAKDVRK